MEAKQVLLRTVSHLKNHTVGKKEGDNRETLKERCRNMTKDLELAKKLAVLGWIHRNGFISDDEYARAKSRIMGEYKICSFMAV